MRTAIDPMAAMFLHFPSDTSTNVVTVAILEGDVDPAAVRAVLPVVQAAWPMLNVHPERVNRRWWYTTDGTPAIDLEVLSREDDEHWQRLADELANTPSMRDPGPLLRLVLLRTPGDPNAELLFVWDHLIVDGVGPGAVIAELLTLLDGAASGDGLGVASIHPQVPGLVELVQARFSLGARTAAVARYLARSAAVQRSRRSRTRRFPPKDADALANTGRARHDLRGP